MSNEVESDMSIKIGLVGPSGSGKTSLLTAIYHETQTQLEQSKNAMSFWSSDEPTEKAINRAMAMFRTCVSKPDGLFDVPQMGGDDKVTDYRFDFSLPGDKKRININIMDFPGGYLGRSELNEKVLPHLNSSVALLIPVSTDMLITWKDTLNGKADVMRMKQTLAYEALSVEHVRKVIKDWLQKKSDNGETGVLIFVPVKCEAWFNDNGGSINESEKIVKAVEELYLTKDMINIMQNAPKPLSALCYPVDTYGIVELQRVRLQTRSDGAKALSPIFQRRIGMGNDIRSCNACEVLIKAIESYLEDYADRLDISIKDLESIISGQSWLYKKWLRIWEVVWQKDPNKKKLAEQLEQQNISLKSLKELKNTFEKSPQRQFVLVSQKGRN